MTVAGGLLGSCSEVGQLSGAEGGDELSARQGAGNVSSRPEQRKAVHTHPPSVYRRFITDKHRHTLKMGS